MNKQWLYRNQKDDVLRISEPITDSHAEALFKDRWHRPLETYNLIHLNGLGSHVTPEVYDTKYHTIGRERP